MWAEFDALVNRYPVDVPRDNGTVDRVWVKGLLDQLAEATQGTEAGNGSSGKPTSRPPISIEVVQLNADIHDAIAAGHRKHGACVRAEPKAALTRLCMLATDTEGPQWAARFTDWAQRIRDVTGVEKARTIDLRIECPSCGQSWVDVSNHDETIKARAVYVAMLAGKVLAFDCRGCGDALGLLNGLVDDNLMRLAA
jgi:hypothetical protein